MNDPTLLIVDDEPHVINSLKRLLIEVKLNITSAANAEEALRLMSDQPVDIVISDYKMPGLTGIQFLQQVHLLYPDTVTFLLTAYADLDIAIEAINTVGVNKLFQKPWQDTELIAAVSQARQIAGHMENRHDMYLADSVLSKLQAGLSETAAKRLILPFALPETGEAEIVEVVDTIRSGWLTTGPKTARFEREFAEYVGARHALAVNSATAGLHLALDAIGVGPGDRVITTPNTFTASAEIIRYLGADPVFVDIDPSTMNLDVGLVEKTLAQMPDETGGRTGRMKAIVPVHFGGQACDMDRIMALAQKYDLKVVEDAAHALPCTVGGKMVGTIGDATVFSFYATKTLSTGEGGMITTNSDEIANRIRVMRLHGISRDIWDRYRSEKPKWYYEVVAPGFKYNMTDIAASLGIHQLEKVDRFRHRRADIARRYDEAFDGLPLQKPVVAVPTDKHAWHLYVIQLELDRLSITRDQFIEKMAEKGIGTSVHFIPLHIQPYWRDRYDFKPEDFPVAYHCFQRTVSLPIYPKMTDADVEQVIRAVRDILHEYQS